MSDLQNFKPFDHASAIHFQAAGGVFAALEALGCMPACFTFTPVSQNAYFEFLPVGWSRLDLVIRTILMHGSHIYLCEGITSEPLEMLADGRFSDLFNISEDFNLSFFYPDRKDEVPHLLWKGHFYWRETKQSGLFSKPRIEYGFDFVGWCYRANSHGFIISLPPVYDASSPTDMILKISNIFHGIHRNAFGRSEIERALEFDVKGCVTGDAAPVRAFANALQSKT